MWMGRIAAKCSKSDKSNVLWELPTPSLAERAPFLMGANGVGLLVQVCTPGSLQPGVILTSMKRDVFARNYQEQDFVLRTSPYSR